MAAATADRRLLSLLSVLLDGHSIDVQARIEAPARRGPDPRLADASLRLFEQRLAQLRGAERRALIGRLKGKKE